MAIVPALLICAWSIQQLHIRWAVHKIATLFPMEQALPVARAQMAARYPEYTEYSAADCEYWSHHTVPAYTARGGPCIQEIKRSPNGLIESAVIIYGSDGRPC